MPHPWEREEEERKAQEKEAKRLAKLQAQEAKKAKKEGKAPEVVVSTATPTIDPIEEVIKPNSTNRTLGYIAGIVVLGAGVWFGSHVYFNSKVDHIQQDYKAKRVQREAVVKELDGQYSSLIGTLANYNAEAKANNYSADSLDALSERNYQGSITSGRAYDSLRVNINSQNQAISIYQADYERLTKRVGELGATKAKEQALLDAKKKSLDSLDVLIKQHNIGGVR